MDGRRRLSRITRSPARFVVLGFLLVITVGTGLLLLPLSTQSGQASDVIEAAFTATSAVCVTGLTVVDTGTHWSGFGQAVILGLIEVGGLGFMTVASLIVLLVSRRLGLRQQMVTHTERSTLQIGEVRQMLMRVGVITLTVQLSLAVWLTVRMAAEYEDGLGAAAWSGTFHAVSAFNNAGFGLRPDSLVSMADDAFVLVPVMVAIVIGGLGFPVLADIDHRMVRPANRRRRRVLQRWDALTLHSKVTITTTAALLAVGAVVLGVLEWSNAETLGPMPVPEKLLNSAFASVTPRTAGFNTVETGLMRPASLLITTVLMFIGAGSAGTSGGIKVGTFSILAMVIWSQVRGERQPTGFRRTIPEATIRQAITVALLAVALVVGGAASLLVSREIDLGGALFETVSAFGTVGLSTGVTPSLGITDDIILMALMLIGRVGPITLGAALVLRQRPTASRVPEEAPLIG